jgi:hypothetical protein
VFRRIEGDVEPSANLHFEERRVPFRPGDTVAAALLLAGVDHLRATPVSGAPRAPYCMMGVCFDCLVVIDGVGSRRACLTRAREGMRVERQRGARALR